MLCTGQPAFQRWVDAQNQLKNAADVFFDACAALSQSINGPCVYSVSYDHTEKTILQVYNHINSLDAIEARIAEARVLVHRTINKSKTRVPVNTLPPELLGRIFIDCMPPWDDSSIMYDNPTQQLNDIAGVCSQWRQVSLSTASLWSHLIINILSSKHTSETQAVLEQTEIWLERALGAPLHLIIHDGEFLKRGPDEESRLLSLLQPHIPRVATLRISYLHPEYYNAIMDLYDGRQMHPELELLSANAITYQGTIQSDDESTSSTDAVRPTGFLWPVSALQGLSQLALYNIYENVTPTFKSFVETLSQLSELRILRLHQLRFPDSFSGDFLSVTLPNLGTLSIRDSYSDPPHLLKLFSLLRAGAREVEVEANMRLQDDIEVQAFFQYANVTVLQLRDSTWSSSSCLAQVLDNSPQLRTLETTFLDNLTHGFTRIAGGRTVARCPNLQKLRLDREILTLDSAEQLKMVTEAHHLKELDITTRESAEDVDVVTLRQWLSQRVPSVSATFEIEIERSDIYIYNC